MAKRTRVVKLPGGKFYLAAAMVLPLMSALGSGMSPASAADTRTPVLVELFTSEGCSDCPPADALLQEIDHTQPVNNAQIIVLSEHVDYWDWEGWRDPYSSHQLTLRQQDYAQGFHLDSPYTPQMVIDGTQQFVGSDERIAVTDIQKAAAAGTARLELSSIQADGDHGLAMHVALDSAGAANDQLSGDVWIAVADESDRSSVNKGENSGRTLTHVAVVRTLTRVGKIDHGAFARDVKVNTGPANLAAMRLVAFAQKGLSGKVVAAGVARYPE
jgi:hypothetical protein